MTRSDCQAVPRISGIMENKMVPEKQDGVPKRSNLKKAAPQLIAVGVKNIVLLGYGMTLGFPTIMIPSLKYDESRPSNDGELVLDEDQLSWISSINLITVPLGCLLSGIVTQPIGRRMSMQIVNIPFIVAWLLFHFGGRVELLYLALCITGFSGGILEAPVLTYVAEVTQPYLRGMLSATSSMCVILGIFLQFLFGTFFPWRTVALINIAFPVTAVIALFFIPESPHWLVTKQRFEDAKKSLAWLRGWCSVEEIIPEFNEIYLTVYKTLPYKQAFDNAAFDGIDVKDPSQMKTSQMPLPQKPKFNIHNYLKKTFLMPYFLVCFAFFLGHFSGMTTLQTYAVQIFETLKAPINKYLATVALGIVELLGTLVCVFLVHYVGKRPLSFASTLGCGTCFIIVGIYAYLIGVNDPSSVAKPAMPPIETNATVVEFQKANNTGDYEHLRWIPMSFLIMSALLSHIGIRLLPWILIGEVFTSETRSNASGLASGLGYIFGFAANKMYYKMVHVLTLPGTCWFYGAISILGTIILYFLLPETEGKTLHEIQNHFAGVAKLSNNVGKSRRNATFDDNKKRNSIELKSSHL